MTQLKIGMVGVGVGGAEILPAMEAMNEVDLVAGADINPVTRERFVKRYPGTRAYESVEQLCEDPEVDAVWVSSPNRFHAPHTITALEHGKHVVVEKPMALSLQEAEAMVKAAEKSGVILLAGHTQSYTVPIRAMRRIILSGKLGRLCAIHILSYSDWMLRPRSADELDLSQGGGVPYRQGPHQIDTIRVLGGGKLRSVRAATGQWMPERPIPGYYSAYLEFEDGTPVTTVHNGYGYFLANELPSWGESKQRYNVEERVAVRKAMRAGTRDEDADKQDLRIGGQGESAIFRTDGRHPWLPADLGLVIVSCERGDMRHSQFGVQVYDDEGIHDLDLSADSGIRGRRAELEELYQGVVNHQPVSHDGTWGMATLEVCLAIMQSASERREVLLNHQVPVPEHYDADLSVPYLDMATP